jgi:DNA-binding SARP family transcriptional activator
MELEFEVLGPLEVRLDGERLLLGGTRPRAVLAALLLERNKVVDTRRLIYAIWADDPPSTDIQQIRMAVSVLRQKLGPAGGRISTRPPGYLIRVDRDELDLDVFEDKVDAGLRALHDGEPETAAHLLRAADGRWRGAALGDLESLPVHNFVVEITERREAAREARILADLMVGRHLDLLPELQAMPERTEQLNGCLMVALQRSGRRNEALEVFHEVRRAARELGLDPPRELSTLHQAILVGYDDALNAWLRGRGQPATSWHPRAQDAETQHPSSRPAPAPGSPADGPAVVLHVTAGAGAGRSYRYTAARTCIVGRADDCDPQFTRDPLISRRHCRLDIRPPEISVRDLGSSNGTFVNDRPIGQPDAVDLVDGDEIRVGHVVIRVGVEVPAPVIAPPGGAG